MIDINFDKNPNLYKDYEECIKFLKGINEKEYVYPVEVTKFHVYSEIKTPKYFS